MNYHFIICVFVSHDSTVKLKLMLEPWGNCRQILNWSWRKFQFSGNSLLAWSYHAGYVWGTAMQIKLYKQNKVKKNNNSKLWWNLCLYNSYYMLIYWVILLYWVYSNTLVVSQYQDKGFNQTSEKLQNHLRFFHNCLSRSNIYEKMPN